MNQQSSGPSGGGNKRHNNNRRHHPNQNRPQGGQGGQQQAQGQQQGPRPQGGSGTGGNPNRRRHHHHRRGGQGPRPQGGQSQGQQQGGFNLDRVYEKYLNLLDQHLIARRKYHDLFYRADPAQKNKLERNFYSTLNDIREFENRLAPDVRELFEKRNNGLSPDRTYTSNHELPVEGEEVPKDLGPEDPHYLQSQKNANYEEDIEESTGTMDDYLRYKNLV